jgi:hypothetical protein
LQRTHVIHHIGTQTHILRCFEPFRYCTNFGVNLAELGSLMHKFMKRCRIGFFVMNGPDIPHWTEYLCFGVFQTIPLLRELRCKTGQTGAINVHIHETKWRRNFSQHTHPIHPIGPQTHVLGRFGSFRY